MARWSAAHRSNATALRGDRARRRRAARATERPAATVVLVVLDGFGLERRPAAATRCGRRDAELGPARSPSGRTAGSRPSGEAVGLPAGQMGNSEVGHLNLGAGFPVLQDLPRITAAIADGTLLRQPGAARGAVAHALERAEPAAPDGPRRSGRRPRASTSTSWRWSSWRTRQGLPPDRRAPPRLHRRPRHAAALGRRVPARPWSRDSPDGRRVATVSGRYYAMDRDGRWERTPARVRGDRARRRADRRRRGRGRRMRPTRAARATSSSSRRCIGGLRRHGATATWSST